MGKHLNLLVKILKMREREIPECYYITDEKHRPLAGKRTHVVYHLGHILGRAPWCAGMFDYNGQPLELRNCSTEKEACLAFLDLSDDDLHLKQYAPEFEKIA